MTLIKTKSTSRGRANKSSDGIYCVFIVYGIYCVFASRSLLFGLRFGKVLSFLFCFYT